MTHQERRGRWREGILNPFERKRVVVEEWMNRALEGAERLLAPTAPSTPAALFVDNRFPRCSEQLDVFFQGGLLDARRTTLLFRRYRSSARALMDFAARWHLRTHAFHSLRSLRHLNHEVIFYPFNGMLNLRLLRDDNVAHVFLTHGESNKAATIHRMVRLYDLVLAPGQIAVDRYVEFGVLTAAETSERIHCVGRALTASLPFANASERSDAPPALLYLPTWEGGLATESYTSVGHEATADVLRRLASRLGLLHVLIKPHPNLGSRLFSLRAKLRDLASTLRSHGLRVCVLDTTTSAPPSPQHGVPTYAVVDVSAAEAMTAAHGIPSVVLTRRGFPIYAPKSYLKYRRRATILLDDACSVRDGLNYATSADEQEARAGFERLLFTAAPPLDRFAGSASSFDDLLQSARKRARGRNLRPILPGIDILPARLSTKEAPWEPRAGTPPG